MRFEEAIELVLALARSVAGQYAETEQDAAREVEACNVVEDHIVNVLELD